MATPTTERPAASGERSLPRLQQRYRDEIAPALRDEFQIKNVMQIPGLVKIVVNMGVGEAARDSKLIDGAVRDLATITGQKPVVTRARMSIAQFKLRAGMPIGAHVTLRGTRMWEFADRLPRDTARRPDVGVRRPAAEPGAAPYPGLPRPVAEAVRRQGQLHVWS